MKISASLKTLALRIALAGFLMNSPLHAAPSDLDTVFNPNANAYVDAVVAQADGKLLVGGFFSTLQPNGAASATTRVGIARLNADGSLDAAFNPNANGPVDCLVMQSDGKILIGGRFTALQPNGAASATTRRRLARLNADGSLDGTFDPNANNDVTGLAVQADGKIIVAGNFGTLQPNGAATATVRNRLARLNTDGSLDGTFDPNANNTVACVVVQGDGKIIVGGSFTTLQPNGAAVAITRNRVARLNTDGSVDAVFNPNANARVNAFALQPDGKIFVGGNFTSFQPNGAGSSSPRFYFARLNTDGSLDSFVNGAGFNAEVYAAALQADGKILVSGTFGAGGLTSRPYVTRLNTDGSVDGTLNLNPNGEVYATLAQADARLVVAGFFTTLQPNGSAIATTRNRIARVANDPGLQKVIVTGATNNATLQFLRSGALSEVQSVTFEASVNGGTTWTGLTAASHIAGGWQATGYALPGGTGLIRARGRVVVGIYNASSGLAEVIAPYPTPDLVVEQPAGAALSPGYSALDYGETALGTALTKTFTIRNPGPGTLTISTLATEGANAGEFTVDTSNTDSNVGSADLTTFVVTFAPAGSSGARTATLRLVSNANGTNNPFTVTLTGLGLSATTSTGNDGLNDHAKYGLRALGFDWQQSQPALVQALYGGAVNAGLYTTAQVQSLNVGVPLIQKNATTGQFKLTIALQRSANLQSYMPLSLATGATSVNASGALEFLFTPPAGPEFYRLQAQ